MQKSMDKEKQKHQTKAFEELLFDGEGKKLCLTVSDHGMDSKTPTPVAGPATNTREGTKPSALSTSESAQHTQTGNKGSAFTTRESAPPKAEDEQPSALYTNESAQQPHSDEKWSAFTTIESAPMEKGEEVHEIDNSPDSSQLTDK